MLYTFILTSLTDFLSKYFCYYYVQYWLFPYPRGFCNPVRIHRIRINNIMWLWYDIWYMTWKIMWYIWYMIQYDMIGYNRIQYTTIWYYMTDWEPPKCEGHVLLVCSVSQTLWNVRYTTIWYDMIWQTENLPNVKGMYYWYVQFHRHYEMWAYLLKSCTFGWKWYAMEEKVTMRPKFVKHSEGNWWPYQGLSYNIMKWNEIK